MPVLYREQFIPRPIEQVFAFFSEARNLETITPDWLRFRILTVRPERVQKSTRIEYSLRWRGIPIRWKTLISAWDAPHRFVDEALSSPYKAWHHTHRFRSVRGGTLMTDEVRYDVGWGPLGYLLWRLIVRREVEAIFDYRQREISRLFPGDDVFARAASPGTQGMLLSELVLLDP